MASPQLPQNNHFIPLSTAIEMTALYRNQKNFILKPEYLGQNILPLCETFNRAAIDTLLSKPDCQGLRFYLGMSEDLKIRLLLVAVNANNEDILPSATGSEISADDDNDDVAEDGQRCPEICPPPSPLN